MTAAMGRIAKTIGWGLAGLLMTLALPSTAFAVAPVTQYAMSPVPIAATGSLAVNASVSITVSAETATNSLVPGAVIYLSFTQAPGGGTAVVGATSLGKTPVAFTAATGAITVTYTAPAVLPTGGRDTIKAANAASVPTITATDSYDFVVYVFSPVVIAAPGSLTAGATVPVTLTVEDASAVAVPNATVYLSLVPAAGGGSAAVGATQLTSTPVAFLVGPTGQLVINYQAPPTLPATGVDTIVAQKSPTGVTRNDTVSYSFGALSSLTLSPSPIAAAGSLTPGQVVPVTLAALDAMGHPVAGQFLFLTFVPVTNGGSAMYGTKALSATPTQALTNGAGLVEITYTASSGAPNVGPDTLTASNSKTSPTLSATDTYTVSVGPLDHLVLSPANATVNPGVGQAYTATGYDAAGDVIGDVTSATTFTIAAGSCTGASCTATVAGGHTVTGHDGAATGTATLTIAGVLGGTSAATYHPLTPARILDTRNGTGGLSVFSNHVHQTLTIWGTGGVPSGANAITGNLTVTGQTSGGYLFAGPVAADNPTSSTLNFPTGDDRANAVTVALSNTGTLSITYVGSAASSSAHVIFDVTGYFTPDTTGATYHSLAPARILDTRNGTGGLSVFSNHVHQTLTVRGAGGVPSSAVAITGNLTVTGQTRGGFLFAGPAAVDNPTSSTLNFPIGDDRANAVTVALSNTGTLSITYVGSSAGSSAQVIFDVTGYFTADLAGAFYVPLAPSRVLDTRNGTGGLSLFSNHVHQTLTIWGAGGVPSGATAITGNLTVTGQTSGGYLFAGPTAEDNPTSSTLNFPTGDDRANALTVALSGSGGLSITYVGSSGGSSTQSILDVTGYFVAGA
ncbi:MAG: beta strand repeat-containing protein [Candidatus Limnocylindrales bacterium]